MKAAYLIKVYIYKDKKFFQSKLTTSKDGPVKRYRNKAGMKTQEDYPTT